MGLGEYSGMRAAQLAIIQSSPPLSFTRYACTHFAAIDLLYLLHGWRSFTLLQNMTC